MDGVFEELQLPHCCFRFRLKGQNFLFGGFYLISDAISFVPDGSVAVRDSIKACFNLIRHLNQKQQIKSLRSWNLTGFAEKNLRTKDSCLDIWFHCEDFSDILYSVSNYGMHTYNKKFKQQTSTLIMFLNCYQQLNSSTRL